MFHQLLYSILLLSQAVKVLSLNCQYELTALPHQQAFSSLGYPESYDNNLNCVWILTALPSYQVEVNFEDVSTEDDYDTVSIRDGRDNQAPLLDTLSGEPKKADLFYISSGGSLYISFTSDRSVGSRGFRATFQTALRMKYNITSIIQTRLAETTVTSHVFNNDNVTREIPFVHILTLDSFISDFEMRIDEAVYTGVVNVKREAVMQHGNQSVRPVSSTYISSNRERLKRFSVSINVRPSGSVIFQLKYIRFITRTQSRYVYRAIVQRRQFVNDICVDIYICTSSPLQALRIREIASSDKRMLINKETDHPPGYTVTRNSNYAHISYRPQEIRQSVPADGEFQIQYDFERNFRNGIFYVDNGFFTHIFSPTLREIQRRIVFVLDISGSMAGLKIEQLRIAMSNILQNLDQRVYFNVVLFESVVRVWRRDVGLVRATRQSKASALRYINRLEPDGATNINGALLTGLRLLRSGARNESPLRRLQVHPLLDYIVFLTDGQPTIGVKSPSVILRNIDRQNSRGYGILSIGFGDNVDASFLRDLAERNNGLWRQIYEDADAAVQIQNFLSDSLNAPLMVDFTLSYLDDIAEQSTNLSSMVLRRGSEFVVTGRLRPKADLQDGDTAQVSVTGLTDRAFQNAPYNAQVRNIDRCTDESSVFESNNVSERLFALMRINFLQDKIRYASTENEKRLFRKEAADLSLSYSIVTNFTVLILMRSEAEVTSSARLGRPLLPPFTSSGSTGTFDDPLPWIFQGDPHFLITLKRNLTICFTFGGNPGKVYNLLKDPELGIEVTGRIVSAPARPSDEVSDISCPKKVPLTYFYSLFFSFLKKKISFKVTPHSITVYNKTDSKHPTTTSYPASDNMIHFEDSNARIEVYGISPMHSFVNVTLRGVTTFIVNLHRTRDSLLLNHTKPRADHVDLDVVGAEHFSSEAGGIFGQFSLRKLQRNARNNKVVREDGQNMLLYRNKKMEVQYTEMVDPLVRRHKLKCWYTCEPEILLGKPTSAFLKSYSLAKTKGQLN